MAQMSMNKAVVRRHIDEAVNGQRPEVWDEIMAADFYLHHPLVAAGVLKPGRQGYAETLQGLWSAFPDLHIEVHHLIAEDDLVALHYTESGTHGGTFMGREPTARSYEKQGLSMYRLADGQLQECWLQEDDEALQRQLFS